MITKEPKIQFVSITSHQEIRAMSSLYFLVMAFMRCTHTETRSYPAKEISWNLCLENSSSPLSKFYVWEQPYSQYSSLARKATDECVISVADRKLAENHRVMSELSSKICMVPYVFILLDASF